MIILGINTQRRQILYLLGDLLLLLLALYLSHALRFGFGAQTLLEILDVSTGASTIFMLTTLLFLGVAEGYDVDADFRRRIMIFRLWGVFIVAMITQILAFYLLPDWWWGRGITLMSNLLGALLLTSWRLLVSQFRPRLAPRLRTLILGDNDAGRALQAVIAAQSDDDVLYDVLGYTDGGEGLEEQLAEDGIDCVLVAELGTLEPGVTTRLLACKSAGLRVEDMLSVYKRLTGKVPIYYLTDSALVFGPQFAGTRGLGLAAQRSADIVLSLVGLLLSAPVIALAAAAIKLESPGPVFFTQERVGRGEALFTIIKLRTMGEDAEARTGPVWSAGTADVRVTRVGRFLRRSRIDELPQFFNVLRGDMAIIGPRPERGFFVERLREQIPYFSLRAAVKPGVTGWAQVRYRYGASDEDAAEKLCYDLYAIQELSIALYVLILLKTVQTVLFRPGS